LEELARFTEGSDWFSTTGADLPSQLLSSVDIVGTPRLRLNYPTGNGHS
jgi:hypothetical protein